MEKDYAKTVIDYIRKNPRIHYDDLVRKFPDEKDEGRLFRLLYGLSEKEVIILKDTMIPPAGKRGLERGIFWVNEDNCTEGKLNDTFEFWKLDE